MTLSRNELDSLFKAGIEIVGDFLRIDDTKNKVKYEFFLSDIGQLSIKKKFRLSIKKAVQHILIIHKWDMSKIHVQLDNGEVPAIKSAIKNVNVFFYDEY